VPEFDEDKVVDFLEETMCQGGNIVDFHTSSFFPERVRIFVFYSNFSGLI